tara:strand:- start:405 stop:626 length:222 start_codon:yes stop_codon:yes gene_type:complete
MTEILPTTNKTMTKKITDKNDPNYGIGMSNEELGYDGLPQVLKDGYARIAKQRGMKDAKAYYDYLKELQHPNF